MNGLGDYDRWKCDPDWDRLDQQCKTCDGVEGECEIYFCDRCGGEACSGWTICVECYDYDYDHDDGQSTQQPDGGKE